MSDTERVIGALTQFKESTEKRLDAIEAKVDELKAFKWKVIGGAAAIGFIIGLVFKVAEVLAKS